MNVKGWSVVFKGPRFHAELLQAILDADGVHAEVLSDTGYGVAIDLTDARLLVPEEHAGHARRRIKEAEEAGPTEPEDVFEETPPEAV